MGQRADVLDAMGLAQKSVPTVVRRLRDYYGLSNRDLGEALGLGDTQISARCRGVTKFTPAELAGLAKFFGLPVGVFYLTPEEAVRVALERDPELQGPRVVDLREVDRPPAAGAGSTIPGYRKKPRRGLPEPDADRVDGVQKAA